MTRFGPDAYGATIRRDIEARTGRDLAISAVYELIEWWAALAMGQDADEFLGTQGDEWDTQSDMFLALIGSTVALATLSRLHDRQLVRLGTNPAQGARSVAE